MTEGQRLILTTLANDPCGALSVYMSHGPYFRLRGYGWSRRMKSAEVYELTEQGFLDEKSGHYELTASGTRLALREMSAAQKGAGDGA